MLEKCYLLKFPKTCAKATRISVVSKSNKNSDNGKRKQKNEVFYIILLLQ